MAICSPKTFLRFIPGHFQFALSSGKQFCAPFIMKRAHSKLSESFQQLTRKKVLLRASEQDSLFDLDFEAENEEIDDMSEDMDQEYRSLAESWREILGEEDWEGMLDPMDPLLRSELIRYGEMAQSCYDAFDFEPFSKYCGSCRFPRGEFFERLGMENCGYEISRYLYATSNVNMPNFFKKSRCPEAWSEHTNWIGFVAVSNDEMSRYLGRRDIAISWRGTVTRLEWVADMTDFLRDISSDKIPSPDPTVKIQSGILDLYTDKDESCPNSKYSAREQVLAELKRLLDKYSHEEVSITITGHSLGSALAIICGYDIVETGINVLDDSRAVPVCVFSFSGPRVGNVRFKERVELLGLKILRVVNVHDIVPKSPGLIFNESVPSDVMKMAEMLPWSYSHVGVELALDHGNSRFLKHDADIVCAHNLEAHLHLIDGYHGKGRWFVLASGRDPALVNKGSDFLKDRYMVPPNWRQDENKGMLRSHNGRWIQPVRPDLDDHPEDMDHYLAELGLVSDQ